LRSTLMSQAPISKELSGSLNMVLITADGADKNTSSAMRKNGRGERLHRLFSGISHQTVVQVIRELDNLTLEITNFLLAPISLLKQILSNV